jgi:alpha-N-arabinofuranosidase
MCAQELLNRGFDMESCDSDYVSCYWEKYYTTDTSNIVWKMPDGGVNLNGNYFQRISKSDSTGCAGVYQVVSMTDTVDYNFYVYIKGDSTTGNVSISLMDPTLQTIYYKSEIGIPSSDWQKLEIKIPAHPNVYRAALVISFNGSGNLDLDETSLLPTNNLFGFRKEYYDLFKMWHPNVIRFPGGCFADLDQSHFLYGIGPLDQRRSPNTDWAKTYHRFEIGTDEFIAFCKNIGIEPHLTVNFDRGSAEEAASWVEYCNGSVETKYGAMRAANGHPEPYNVKYWEIGNEQWGGATYNQYTLPQYATMYLDYYKLMKKVDSTISVITDGNLWGGKDKFDTLMGTIKDNCQIFGWHYAIYYKYNTVPDYQTLNEAVLATPNGTDMSINMFDNWLKGYNLTDVTKQGVTEFWTIINDMWWDYYKLFTLQVGLLKAVNIHEYMRHHNNLVMNEETIHSSTFLEGMDSLNRRTILPTPTCYALSMLRNYHGSKENIIDVQCGTYNTPYVTWMDAVFNVPYLDVIVTSEKDTFYVSVVNRSLTDTISTKMTFSNHAVPDSVEVIELNSEHIEDSITLNSKDYIKPKTKTIRILDNYYFPPHSFSVLKITKFNNNFVVDPQNPDDFFKVAPNPVNDELRLFFYNPPINNDMRLKIYNMLGDIVDELTIPPDTKFLNRNVSNLSKGVYYIKCENQGKTATQLFVKD